MTYQIKTTKNMNGWKSETQITLGQTGERETVLTFRTTKGRTIASVSHVKNEGNIQSQQHMVFQDYHQTVAKNDVKRATANTIEKAHMEAMDKFDDHLQAALDQYGFEQSQVA